MTLGTRDPRSSQADDVDKRKTLKDLWAERCEGLNPACDVGTESRGVAQWRMQDCFQAQRSGESSWRGS